MSAELEVEEHRQELEEQRCGRVTAGEREGTQLVKAITHKGGDRGLAVEFGVVEAQQQVGARGRAK